MDPKDTAATICAELVDLRRRLAEAEETLVAIKTGTVDAVVVSGPGGDRVFTLKGAEQPYRVFVETMNEGAATLGPDGTILYCNPRMAELSGVPAERLIGSSIFERFSPALRPMAKAVFEQAHVTTALADLALVQADETPRAVRVSMGPLPLGETAAVCLVVLDLTERRKAERAKALLAAGLEQSTDSVAVLDRQGRISSVNSAFERLNRCMAAQVVGGLYMDFLADCGVPQEERRAIGEAIERGELWSGHSTRRRESLEEAIFDVNLSPVRGDLGDVVAYLAWGRDITRKILCEKDTIRRQKMEALGLLAGGIAHDLNNILTPLMTSLGLAKLTSTESSPVREHLDMSLQAAKLGRDAVRRILTFSCRQEVEREPMRLDSLVRESLALLRTSLPARVALRADIPDCPDIVRANASQIHEVILNLVNNAVYAMREGGGVLEVSLVAVDTDGDRVARDSEPMAERKLRLTVRDTGHGMTSAIAEKVFDPFFTTKGRDEGTGLGLAIVQSIVESHGGSITVHSEVGKGTAFAMLLPCVDAEPLQPQAPIEPLVGGTERVLFVDDEAMQRKTTQQLLTRLGYRVETSSDGLEALALFQADPNAFDLVITDQSMPRLTGDQLARTLLAVRPSIPIVLCTGFSETMDAERAKDMGIREFLAKPYSVKTLASSIRRALDTRSPRSP